MKKLIPNLVTSLNLLSGCISILLAFYDIELAAWFVLGSIVLDFLDGFLARLLRAQSGFGKQLDSLADIVSFGVAPAVILYMIFLKSWNLPDNAVGYLYITPLIVLLVPVFSALRLARFNLDKSQETVFKGLPTPANALLIASLPLIMSQYGDWSPIRYFILNSYVLLILVVVSSLMLISQLPMLSLKFPHFRWAGNQSRYLIITIAIILAFIFRFAAIPMIIAIYILWSLIFFKRENL